jgi:hypothetical protein
MVQFSLRPGVSVASAFHRAGFFDLTAALARYPASLLLGLLVVGAFYGFADATGWRRIVLGCGHGLVQLAVPLLTAWGISSVAMDGAPFIAVLLTTVAVGGGLAAGLVMGIYLFGMNALFGRHPNEVFAGQHIQDFKGFLRVHLGQDGQLTVYPIGLDRVPRRWRLSSRADLDAPWFEPVDGPLEPHLIEPPFSLG